jgi:hypothetical protein
MSGFNMQSCPCEPRNQQFAPIIFNNIAYQDSANVVYESKKVQVSASTAGTLGSTATGNPTFKTNYERMQYLHGQQNRPSCGVPKKSFGTI